MQRERCIAFVTAKGWNIVEVILDEGESAKNLLRPGMQSLLEMVKAKPREVDAVVVLKLDRLTRSVADEADLIRLFNRKGVALSGPEVPFDSSTSTGRLFANITASFAEYEREEIGERTKAVLAHRKQNGLTHAPRDPYGYKRSGAGKAAIFVPVPHEIGTIAVMREMRVHGSTLRQIVLHLNSNGIPTKRGVRWDAATVRKILGREILAT
jgi:site-specific DNA recombinase